MRKILPLMLLSFSLNAQADNVTETPKGKPIAKVFTNFHTGFGSVNDKRGFELDRSYLGYEYKLTHSLTITGIIDFGQSKKVDDYQRIAYIKNMMLQWKHDKLTLKAGLIPTVQFGFQEKFWGYRYVHKSFQDEYKFGDSADLGLSASYKVNDWLTAEGIITNGEGYKKVQINDGLLYGAGLTLTPISGLSLRVYGGFNQDVGEEKKDVYNLATFIGYRHSVFSIGAEYNLMREKNNDKKERPYGLSFYTTVDFNRRTGLFCRYDQLFSSYRKDTCMDEKNAMIGVQFTPCKYIKLAPTFTYKGLKSKDNPEFYAGLYCYFGI